jgi:hypothetical protein
MAFGLQHDSDGGADAGAVAFLRHDLRRTEGRQTISLDSSYGKWTGAAATAPVRSSTTSAIVTDGIDPAFVVGAPGANKAYVVDFPETDDTLANIAAATITGPPGTGTASAGADVNGDGTGDLVLGRATRPAAAPRTSSSAR